MITEALPQGWYKDQLRWEARGILQSSYSYIISISNDRSSKLVSAGSLMLTEHLLYTRCQGAQMCGTWVFHL